MVKLSSEDFGTLCFCAVRYAMGRATYMPSLVVAIIRPHLRELSDKDLGVLHSEFTGRGFGNDKMNAPDWERLYEAIEQEQERRRADGKI